MNKRFYLLSGLAALFMTGCSVEVYDETNSTNPETPDIEKGVAINIDGSIDQEYESRVDDGGFCDGDQVGLYGVNYALGNTTQGTLMDEGNQVDNAKYTYDEATNTWVSSGSIYYKDAETNIDLYAYYPYGHPESVSDYKFQVHTDQSGENVNDGYGASDFLWGKVENVVPSENKVRIRYSHRFSCANVILTEGTGFADGEFENLKKGVLVTNVTNNASINLSTGVATAVGEASAEGTVMMESADGFRAIVVPQTVAAGKALFRITVDGIPYNFRKDEDFTYQPSKQTRFTITINKKEMSGTYEFVLSDTEIIDWVADLESHGGEARQYYVVHMEEAGTLGKLLREAKKNPNKIANLKISGNICAADFYFMRDSMEILKAVNLKETKIVGCWRAYVSINGGYDHDIYFPGEMPESYEEQMQAIEAQYPIGTTIYKRNTNVAGMVDEIPHDAFFEKSTLTYFVFPEKVTKIGYSAFAGTTLSGALIIPNDCVEIGDSAFENTNISSLQLSHNVKVLGNNAFFGCSSLSGTLSLPESLEKIGYQCFYICSMLTGELVLPLKLKEIPSGCFTNCTFTGDLVIPEGVESIGSAAFSGCDFSGTLTLPSTLQVIEVSAFSACSFQGELFIPRAVIEISAQAFCNNEFSSIVFEEGSELVKIGERAFEYNSRLTEPVIIPEGVTTLGSYAFDRCSTLSSIILPSTLATIGNSAFKNCYGLTNLVCNATMPPIVGSGAFDGVAKDNFTLQVPEAAVSRYQTASGWNEFKRISAYYDFSISRKQIRALNAEYSDTYILRVPQGLAWSIESKPDWVTVTPSSGVGKAEVTITVGAMADSDVATFDVTTQKSNSSSFITTTYDGRGGEIVFLLDDKDYRVKMAVEQYDYDYADGDVITNQTAQVGGGVNLVFMGDCFDAQDIATGKYLTGVNQAIDYYFGIEPYKHYRDYFNVYTVIGMSPESGMGTVNTIREAKFGSQYSLDGIAPNTEITYEYAMKAPTVTEGNLNQTLVIMVENTTDYGGICYMWGDGSAIAVCPMSADAYPYDFRGIVQHEAGGHGFAKLADEYIYHNAFIQSCECNCCSHLKEFNGSKALGWYRNLSTNGDYNTVEWSHLFFHPDYSGIVDMYEGGYFHTRGIYRSEATSCMNNNIPYYSAIQRQEMVERIMRYAGLEFNISDFYANDVRDASNNFVESRSMGEGGSTDGSYKQKAPKYMGEKPVIRK